MERMKVMHRLQQQQTAFACPSFSAIVVVSFGRSFEATSLSLTSVHYSTQFS